LGDFLIWSEQNNDFRYIHFHFPDSIRWQPVNDSHLILDGKWNELGDFTLMKRNSQMWTGKERREGRCFQGVNLKAFVTIWTYWMLRTLTFYLSRTLNVYWASKLFDRNEDNYTVRSWRLSRLKIGNDQIRTEIPWCPIPATSRVKDSISIGSIYSFPLSHRRSLQFDFIDPAATFGRMGMAVFNETERKSLNSM
jgi:hypothetical protein